MSHISPQQYEKFISQIKENFPEWNGEVSSIPITVNGRFDMGKEEFQIMVDKVVKEIMERYDKMKVL